MVKPSSERSGIARKIVLGVACALLVFGRSATPVAALVIRSGDGSGNTSAPVDDDDPGWNHVGKVSSPTGGFASGTYVGNRWVLVPRHIQAIRIADGEPGSIDLNGTTYNFTGAEQRMKNPGFPAETFYSELQMYRINGDPGLPDLNISTTTPAVGQQITLIGVGRDRETDLNYWQRLGSGESMTWTDNGSTGPGNETGYKTLSTRTKRWGQNTINDDAEADPDHTLTIKVGGLDVVTIVTDFDETGGPTHEAQTVSGDSGGALFHKDGGNWELAGVSVAVGVPSTWAESNYPGSSNAVFKYFTLAVDLPTYADQIERLVNPTPGDMNVDGDVDTDDVPWFVMALTDVDAYVDAFSFLADAADVIDFGDMDENGLLDLADLVLFNAAAASGSASASSSQIVPEPSSLALLIMASLTLLALARQKRS